MNKSELIAAVAKSAKVSKADAARAVDAFISNVTGSLKKGKKVTIPGFAVFEKVRRPARTGRNPRTGKAIKIAARNTVKIKAGKTLKDSVK